jgi:uncharacterized protein
MSARYRGWRFEHPDIGGAAGLAVSNTGGVAMVEGDDAIRQAIMLLISTRPGERVMRPQYGCDLQRLMFLPNDETTAGLAIHHVRKALERWEPRIDIIDIDAIASAQSPERLEITLEYRVRATSRVDNMSIALHLSGESP